MPNASDARFDASKNVRDRALKHKQKFNEDPGVFSVYGYSIISLSAKLAQDTGPNLATENFPATLERTTFPRDMFGADEMSFNKTKHLG